MMRTKTICIHLPGLSSRVVLPRLGEPQQFTRKILCESLSDKIYRNTMPDIPGGNPPGATSHPERIELKPTPVAVPDPAKTESATATRISIPAYPELKRFSQAIGEAAKAASELFELESNQNWDKENKRRDAVDWLDEAKRSLFDV
jgi:hypothetical protein